MRIIRDNMGCWYRTQDTPADGREAVIEIHLALGRLGTKLLRSGQSARSWWFETVACHIGRANCRFLRRHNVTCRGRRDHQMQGVGIIDPDRWNGWPR